MMRRMTRLLGAGLALLLTLGVGGDLQAAPAAKPAPVRAEILWDTWGVPHIFARTDNDLFYALGWATMHNHANVMLRLYGQARGRAAEYWGESFVESDIQVRTLKIGERAERALAQQTPAFRAKLDAFAEGVNAYAAAHPDRIGPELKAVLPVQAVDFMAHQQRSGVLPFAFAALKGDVDSWMSRGSNAWALGPKKSASGNAMLVMNPHIPWGDIAFGGLFRIFEVDAKSPSMDFYGAMQVGTPVVSGGFNDHLGWTGTVNTLDDVDVYELTLAEGGYVYDGVVRPFDETRTTFKVRKADGTIEERPLVIRWSVQGPVIGEKPGKALAVRLAAIDMPFQYQQYWDMTISRSWKQFRKAIARMQFPKQNLIYADAKGNIFYLASGRIPARKDGDYAFWEGIVPGDTSRTLWTDVLPFEALPQTFNPPAGWLQNENEPPWYVTDPATFTPEQFPAWMSPRSLGPRSQRSLRMITARPLMTFEDVMEDKLSTRSELADRLVDDLVAAAQASGGDKAVRAAAVLAAWDREMDGDSRGAILFMAWLGKYKRPYDLDPALFREVWVPGRPMATPAGLANPAKAVALLEAAADETIAKYGALDVPYGDIYRLRWSGGIDLPGNGATGGYGVFRVTDYLPDADGKRRAFQGDSFVSIMEFSTPVRARVLLSYGNASQPGSPHDGDQLRLYSAKALRPVWRTRAEIEANLEEREVLR